MAINANLLRRPSDKNLFLTAAIGFPLLVFVGYFKTYYFSRFFDVPAVANWLVHAHGVVMSLWVVYFVAQIGLARTKNLKLHITLGFAGIGLAALVVVVGLATAYDAHIVRQASVPNVHPHSFFMIPLTDMLLFVVFFGAAIFYRKRPGEHKTLMLMTAINFLPAALGRIPLVPEKYLLLWAFGVPCLMAIACLGWHSVKHGKLNAIFAASVLLYVVAQPIRIIAAFSDGWLQFMNWAVS